jgi:hypothetical protein
LPELDRALGDLDAAATGLAEFLDGPRLYLVFAANNNEMRIGSGAFLSASVLVVSHGDLVLLPTRPTATLRLGPFRAWAVHMDADQAKLWGWLAPNDEWRNLGVSPRFDTTARLSTQMVAVVRDVDVDGVLALDPVALEHLVDATGPVRVGSRTLSGERLLQYLLVDQYRGVDFFDTQQKARRDALGTLAQQAIGQLDAGHWDTRALVAGLRTAGSGRHLLAWSRHPDEQRAWNIAGIDGRLSRDSLMVGLHNRGGNKLDPFVGADSVIRTERVADGTDVSVTVTLANRTPRGLPRYVAGPYPDAVGGGRNVYQGILTLYAPGSAPGIEATRTSGRGQAVILAAGRDGPSRVVGVQVKLRAGEHDRLRFRFHLPTHTDALVVEPSGRWPNIRWRHEPDRWFGHVAWDDTEARTISLR